MQMDTENLEEVLREAGLSKYQAAAYVALLELGTATAGELASASEVPRPRIYDVLRDLESKGYIETYETDSLRARIPDPEAVTDDLTDRITRLRSATDEITQRWQAPTPDEHEVSVVSRFETVVTHTEDLVDEAEYHVQLSVTPELFERFRPRLEAARERGVYVQLSLHSVDESDLESLDLEGTCTEARVRARPAPYLALIDQQRVCYAAHIDAPNEYGVLIDDRTTAYVFLWFYLTTLWELWDPLYDDRPTQPPYEYLDIRRFVREMGPVLQDGSTVRVRVVGRELGTGTPCDVSGTLSDVYYEGESPDGGDVSLLQLAGQVSVELDVDGETYWVGGFGALVEDIEARRLIVESIDGESGTRD